jgi:hypothetical protein
MPHHQNFLDDQWIFDAGDDYQVAIVIAGRSIYRFCDHANPLSGRRSICIPPSLAGTFGTVAGVITRLFSLRANRPEAITQIPVDQALVTRAAKQPAPAL